MLLPIKPICKRNKIRRDGTSLIFIQYCYTADKRTLLSTGIAIPPIYWNRKSLRISNDLPLVFGKADELNDELQKLIRIAEDIVSFAMKNKINDLLSFLKENFNKDYDTNSLIQKTKTTLKQPNVNLNIYYQIDDYIESNKKKVTPGMLNVYKNMKDHLFAFEQHRGKPITFECIDFNFYESFVDYLTYEHIQRRRKVLIKVLKTSTVGKTIKQLRIFLKNRMRKKIITPIDLEDFKILDEEADAIYLSKQEISRIYEADLSTNERLMKYRNLLVLGCLTGLRFSDFSQLKPEDMRNEMLYKKQSKSDGWVVIPLRKEAREILTDQFKNGIPRISNPEFNKYIKEVGKMAGIDNPVKFSHKKGNRDIVKVKPKYEWITSHTCRRSFCTNEFLAGTPVELIMKISGHKSVKDFYKYIKVTPEQAALQIDKIWKEREETNAIQNPYSLSI
jgi:integrase